MLFPLTCRVCFFAPPFALSLLAAISLVACDISSSPPEESEADLLVPKGESNSSSPVWIYNGPFKALKGDSNKLTDVHVYVSIVGGTARVTGCLPKQYDGDPNAPTGDLKTFKESAPYALIAKGGANPETTPDEKTVFTTKCRDDQRNALTVVYPIASGAKKEGEPGYNNVPGVYRKILAHPFSPTDKATNG